MSLDNWATDDLRSWLAIGIMIDTFDIDVNGGESVHEKYSERMYIGNGKRRTYWDGNGGELSL